MLTYVLLIDLAAVALAVTSLSDMWRAGATDLHLPWFGLLLTGAIGHAELMKRLERLHQAGSTESSVVVTTDTLWYVAGLLLLPFPLVISLVGACWLHQSVRVTRNSPPYRMVFSAAACVVALGGSAGVLRIGGIHVAHLPEQIGQVLGVLLAITAYDIAGIALVVFAILLSSPTTRLRPALGTVSEHAFELGAGALGAFLSVTLATAPALLPLVVAMIGIQGYAALLPGFVRLSQRDEKTGLLRSGFWHKLCERECVRARRHRQPVGILMIDIDRFKQINDLYGHLTGDVVLRSVAGVITAQLHREHFAGRFGGEEFVVFLRNVNRDQVRTTAELVRRAVADVTIPSGPRGTAPVTVSIGACWSSDPDETLSAVMLSADTALFAAKNRGRNCVQLAPVRK